MLGVVDDVADIVDGFTSNNAAIQITKIPYLKKKKEIFKLSKLKLLIRELITI